MGQFMHLTENRSFISNLLLIAVIPCLLLSCVNNDDNEEESLVIASYGGKWQEVLQLSMFQPFSIEYGREVEDVVYNGLYESVVDQAESIDLYWDIVNVEGNMVILGERDGILEPIDYSGIDTSVMNPDAIHTHGTGIMAWSFVLAYSTNAFGEMSPASWADFFDVDQFEGSRGLRNDPRRTLEIALIADGVSKDQLYPLDLDRAFEKLDALKQNLEENNFQLIWWDDLADPGELLSDGEVVMTPGTNGRIYANIEEDNYPVDYIWQGGIVDFDWWMVMSGSSMSETAMEFIAYASSVEAQSEMARLIPYGPVNSDALEVLTEEERERLPTNPPNLEKQLIFNTEWWSENYDDVLMRWNNWFESQ